jgi:hypothetical protein
LAIYILTDNQDEEIFQRVSELLSTENVDVHQTGDDELTEAEWRKIDAASTLKQKTYLGRLVGNTQRLEKDVRGMNDLLQPISIFFANLLEEQEHEKYEKRQNEAAKRIAESRTKRAID